MRDELRNGLRGLMISDGVLAHNGDAAIKLGDESWTPDDTTGYMKARCSFGFPNVNVYGDGIYPAVIGRSFHSMCNKPVNWRHTMAAWGRGSDKIGGTVVGVDFPADEKKMVKDKAKAPFMTVVGALWLNSEVGSEVVEELKKSNRKDKSLTVSMEVVYSILECGFAVQMDGASGKDEKDLFETPKDMAEAGFDYVPMTNLVPKKHLSQMSTNDLVELARELPKESLLRTRDWAN